MDFWSLKRPEFPVRTRTLTDPAHPEHPVTLSLRKLDLAQATHAHDLADARIRLYVDGEHGQPANLYPCRSGNPIRLNRTLVERLTLLELMQAGETRLDFDQLVAFSLAMPTACAEALFFATEVMHEEAGDPEDPLGNSPEAGAGAGSAPGSA